MGQRLLSFWILFIAANVWLHSDKPAYAECAAGYTQQTSPPIVACRQNTGNVPITARNLTNGSSATGGTSVTTASISPGANNLDIVSVQSYFTGANNIPTVTGAGGTWTIIATQADATSNRRVTLFRDLSASPGSGPLTISFGQAANPEAWSVDEFSNTDTTGTHGSGAIVQSVGVTANSTSSGASIPLAALFSAHDATMGYIRINQTSTVSAGAGFTQLSNIVNASDSEAEWAIDLTPVTWTWSSQSVVDVGLAIEIKSATP